MRRPQAVFNRCMWWANLTSWPNGASADDTERCIDRAMGRTADGSAIRSTIDTEQAPTVTQVNQHIGLILLFGFSMYILFRK